MLSGREKTPPIGCYFQFRYLEHVQTQQVEALKKGGSKKNFTIGGTELFSFRRGFFDPLLAGFVRVQLSVSGNNTQMRGFGGVRGGFPPKWEVRLAKNGRFPTGVDVIYSKRSGLGAKSGQKSVNFGFQGGPKWQNPEVLGSRGVQNGSKRSVPDRSRCDLIEKGPVWGPNPVKNRSILGSKGVQIDKIQGFWGPGGSKTGPKRSVPDRSRCDLIEKGPILGPKTVKKPRFWGSKSIKKGHFWGPRGVQKGEKRGILGPGGVQNGSGGVQKRPPNRSRCDFSNGGAKKDPPSGVDVIFPMGGPKKTPRQESMWFFRGGVQKRPPVRSRCDFSNEGGVPPPEGGPRGGLNPPKWGSP